MTSKLFQLILSERHYNSYEFGCRHGSPFYACELKVHPSYYEKICVAKNYPLWPG
jgi:hypothetical protein